MHVPHFSEDNAILNFIVFILVEETLMQLEMLVSIVMVKDRVKIQDSF